MKQIAIAAALGLLALVAGAAFVAGRSVEAEVPRRTLLIVLDGLRPDYVTPDRMPNLSALAERGVWASDHHAVYPTVTRVNAPSIATGAPPAEHGILGNAVYLPDFDRERVVDTGSSDALREADSAIGPLVTAPTLGDLLEARGGVLLVASSGTPGSAFLLHPRPRTGAVLNNALVLPETLATPLADGIGGVPDASRPNLARNRRAVDAYLDFGLERLDPDVTILWLSDPDNTAHAEGIGTARTVAALAGVDAELGRIQDALHQRGMLAATNIIVTSDHGFSTHVGNRSFTELLVEHGLKRDAGSLDVVVAGGAIHVLDGGPQRVTEIVQLLQRTPWAGAVFTRDGPEDTVEGSVPGTFGFSAIGWNHPRAADILVGPHWTDAVNEHGFPGATYAQGTAGHGSASPWDIRATFVAAGPDFKSGVRSSVPTGHIDIAPTVLHLHGIPPAPTMRGRLLHELLADGPDPGSVNVLREVHEVSSPDVAGYRAVLRTAIVEGVRYLDSGRAEAGR